MRGIGTSDRSQLSLARRVSCDEQGIRVTLEDGRTVSTPLTQRLREATPEQRRRCRVVDFGTALRWEDVDEDVGLDAILGVPEDELLAFAGFTPPR